MIEDFSLLANYGAMGIVMAWFMFRMERIIKANTDAINNLTLIVGKKLRC